MNKSYTYSFALSSEVASSGLVEYLSGGVGAESCEC